LGVKGVQKSFIKKKRVMGEVSASTGGVGFCALEGLNSSASATILCCHKYFWGLPAGVRAGWLI